MPKAKPLVDLGAALRAAMEKKGYTTAELSRLAGVSYRHLLQILNGSNVSVLLLRKLARVLELTEVPLGGGLTGDSSVEVITPEVLLWHLDNLEASLVAAREQITNLRRYVEDQKAASRREATALVREVAHSAKRKHAKNEEVKQKA